MKNETRTMLFYEAPHKLAQTLKDMNKAFGNREVAIVREITKIHEEVIRTTLDDAVEKYADGLLKGEMVIILKGTELPQEEEITFEQAVSMARDSVNNKMSVSEAAKQTAKLTGYKKGDIYKQLIGE